MIEVKIQSTANPAFIDYLCRKSRYGSFILPNFRQKGSGGKIKENRDFSKWLYPDFPEDFCLFDEQGACILYCQTHENVCRLYGESEREKKQYRDWGVVYEAYEDLAVERPCIKTI